MVMLAILGRELRAESRRSLTYWLRVLTVGVVVAACYFLAREQNLPRAEIGVKMFGGLNAMLFGAIWVLIPLLSADCLSREKREATLGLLFLTPLRPGEVVHAKVLVHLLRAGGLLLAVVPAMTVPFLFGGVTWRECVVALLLNSGAMLTALSAGLLASALCKQWVRALVLAETLSCFCSRWRAWPLARRAASTMKSTAAPWSCCWSHPSRNGRSFGGAWPGS